MSADKNRSNGAPLEICMKKLPEDPNERRTGVPVCFSKAAARSVNAKFRSAAAAMVKGGWATAPRDRSSNKQTKQTRIARKQCKASHCIPRARL